MQWDGLPREGVEHGLKQECLLGAHEPLDVLGRDFDSLVQVEAKAAQQLLNGRKRTHTMQVVSSYDLDAALEYTRIL